MQQAERVPIAACLSEPGKRPTLIHKRPCKWCPSAHYAPDPEALDIKETWPRAAQIESVFPCGWSPSRMCKGYADFLGVTEADLKEVSHAE